MVAAASRRWFLRSGLAGAAGLLLPREPALAVTKGALIPMNVPSDTLELGIADLDGRRYELKDYRGKVLLVSFWATWCPPCRDEMPSLARLSRRLPADRFAILAVNLGDRRPRVEKFLDGFDHTGLPVLLDEETALGAKWYVAGLPVTYVLDPSGNVRLAALGGRDWESPEITAQIEALAKN